MKSVKLAIVTAAVLAAVPALAQLKLDANLEYTYGYESKAAEGTTKATNATTQSGRVEVIALSRREVGDAFFEGKGVIRLRNDATTAIQDVYGQFGRNNAWNLKFGRFEATDLFPTGKDQALVDSNKNGLRGNDRRGRTGEAANPASHFALTVMASPSVSVELGVQLGTKTENQGLDPAQKVALLTNPEVNRKSETMGLRPIVSFKAGVATIKVGLESGSVKVTKEDVSAAAAAVPALQTAAARTTEKDDTVSNFAVTAALPAMGGNLNVNVANGASKDNVANTKKESLALGLNGTWGSFGAGIILDDVKSTDATGTAVKTTQTSLYAAYSLPVLAVPNATFTIGAGIENKGGDVAANTSKSANLINARFNYTF